MISLPITTCEWTNVILRRILLFKVKKPNERLYFHVPRNILNCSIRGRIWQHDSLSLFPLAWISWPWVLSQFHRFLVRVPTLLFASSSTTSLSVIQLWPRPIWNIPNLLYKPSAFNLPRNSYNSEVYLLRFRNLDSHLAVNLKCNVLLSVLSLEVGVFSMLSSA